MLDVPAGISSLPLTIAVVSLTFLFYGYFLYTAAKRSRSKIVRRDLFRATIAVLSNNEDDDSCIPQIELSFRKVTEKYPSEMKTLRSCVNVLESLVANYDMLGQKRVKSLFQVDVSVEMRNRIYKITDRMKTLNPFASLDSRDANLLSTLQQAIGTRNLALGNTALRQLAEEIEVKESAIRTQENRSNTSFMVAIIGVVLTIVFGILSFL
jgi:hypothetical protein